MTIFYQVAGKSLHSTRTMPNTLEELQETLKPLVARPGETVLFLDLDGTLAPIMPQPREVVVPPGTGRLIRKLAHQYLAVAVVSGRPATEAKRITGNSELTYIGNHGFETMLPGHAVVVCDEAQPYISRVRELLKHCRSFMAPMNLGILLEDKTATMSIHYRLASDPGEALKFIRKNIFPRIEELGLSAGEGRMVIDVKPPVAVNKGVAIGRLMDRLGAAQALYAGDDTTDIDALKELRQRRRKKQAVVGVGVISDEMPRNLSKYADLMVERMSGVEMVLQILAGEEL